MSLDTAPFPLVVDVRAVARDVAARPELWRPHVHHDPRERVYRELHVRPDVSVWLICWMAGHDTGFHDHDGSGGAVAVVEGAVREDRLTFEGPVWSVRSVGEVFEFDPADIHRLAHHGTAPAVTVHAYWPPLKRMGAYVPDREGRLRREVLPEGTELRPAAVTAIRDVPAG